MFVASKVSLVEGGRAIKILRSSVENRERRRMSEIREVDINMRMDQRWR